LNGIARLVILASGSGTNLQAILDACTAGVLPARVVAVVSDHAGAYALERARQAGVPALYHPWEPFRLSGKDRRSYDAALAKQVAAFQPQFIVLAGWMRLLTPAFLESFPFKVVNLHPALPGTFPGTHAIQRAWNAYRAGEIEHTGVMIHFVPDEGVDNGPLIMKEEVEIYPDDTLEDLESRIHAVEHRLLVSALRILITQAGFEQLA
jgi:phosphoribosylglycinamide formyltransferase-1